MLSPALSSQTIISATGFDTQNQHCKTGETVNAIIDATFAHLVSNAFITVNPYAGGTYPIVGVVESALSSEIMALMTSFNFNSQHSKADVFPKAVAKAVANTITTKAKVIVPTNASGKFYMEFVVNADIRSAIEGYMIAEGFKLSNPYAQTRPLINALSNELARAFTLDAEFIVNGTSGGVFFPV